MKTRQKAFTTLLTIFFVSNIYLSQTLNFQTLPSEKNQFAFSFDKQFFDSDIDPALLTGIFQLYANIPLSSKLNLVGNLQYLNISYEYNYSFGRGEYSESGFGNIFVGLQTNPQTNDRMSVFTFGLFLPTAEQDISLIGTLTNSFDLLKYMYHSMGIYFNYAYHKLSNQGLHYCVEIGPNIAIPTKDEGNNTELFIHYGAGVGYQIEKISLNAEFQGIAVVTEDVDKFEDRFINSLNIGAQWKEENFVPELYFRYYLKKDLREFIDGVLGLGVRVYIQ